MSTFGFLTATIGWSLVHSIWQITLITIAVKLILHIFSNSPSTLKYNIVLAGIFTSIAAFGITLAAMAERNLTSTTEGILVPQAIMAVDNQVNPLLTGLPELNTGLLLKSYLGISQWISSSIYQIMTVWFAGFLFFTFRFMGSYFYIHRLKKNHSHPLSAKWQSRLQSIQSGLNMGRAVVLLESASIKIPVVIGHLKPAIILPLGLVTHIPFNQLEAILVHELAHIRRNDYLVNLIVSAMEWIFFFHPLFWWLSRKLDLYREHCCDDITVKYCGKAEHLQKALLDLSIYNQKLPTVAAALYKNENQLLNRIKRMKTKNQKNHGNRFNPGAFLLIIAVFSLVFTGSSIAPRSGDILHGIVNMPQESNESNSFILQDATPPAPFSEPEQSLAPLPDTVKPAKKETTVKEFEDDGAIRLILDRDGNLISVKKDGKELEGSDREKYEKLTKKLKEAKEEEKELKQKEEELEMIKERLKETEKKMKEAQQEYGKVWNDYMQVQSEAGWHAYDESWGLHSDQLLKTEEIEKLMQEHQDLAGIYNQGFFENQENWTELQEDLLWDQVAENEEWTVFRDRYEDQNWISQEQLEKEIQEHEMQRALRDELLQEQMEELETLDELYQIDMDTRIFEEIIRMELVQDGLLDKPNSPLSFELSEKRLVVNGKKQNSDLHKKYLKLYEKQSDTPFSGDMRIIIED